MVNLEYNLIKMIKETKDIVYVLEVEPEFKFTYINNAVYDTLGYSPEEVFQNSEHTFKLVHKDDSHNLKCKMIEEGQFCEKVALRIKSKNGKYIWIEFVSMLEHDCEKKTTYISGIGRNVTEQKEKEKELIRLKNIDDLTKVKSRYSFETIIKQLEGRNSYIGLFFIDVDRLKNVNDLYGHLEGDKLICLVAEDLKEKIGDNGMIFRYGGDEFIIIIQDKSIDECNKYYYKLRNQNIHFHGEKKSFSIGFSYSKNKKIDIKKLINEADKNMYEVKLSDRK